MLLCYVILCYAILYCSIGRAARLRPECPAPGWPPAGHGRAARDPADGL